jgi:adenylate kinase family enzyme
MKILVVGYSGSGKSTFAKFLSEQFKLSLLHLDTVQFYGDWESRSIEEQNQIVRDFMKNKDDWVIDGNYSRVAPERFNQADIIFNLKMNRLYCYFMAFNRYRNHRGKKRDSLGVMEKFDWEFQWWLLYKGRSRSIRKKRNELIASSAARVYVIKTRKQLNDYIKQIRERGL